MGTLLRASVPNDVVVTATYLVCSLRGYGMGLRFRRTWSVFPGIRLNLGLKSGSVSFGMRGLHYTVGTRGSRITAGIPGTGLFWTKKINSPFSPVQPRQVNQTQTNSPPMGAGAQPPQFRPPQTYSPPIGAGAKPPQFRPPQTYSPPIAAGAQPPQLRQVQTYSPIIGGATQLAQLSQPQRPVQSNGTGNKSSLATHFHAIVPSWLVWAVLAVIIISGVCVAASIVGELVH